MPSNAFVEVAVVTADKPSDSPLVLSSTRSLCCIRVAHVVPTELAQKGEIWPKTKGLGKGGTARSDAGRGFSRSWAGSGRWMSPASPAVRRIGERNGLQCFSFTKNLQALLSGNST